LINSFASVAEEPAMPGDQDMERRIRALIRWNALAMVLRANKTGDDLGGHLASFASSATLHKLTMHLRPISFDISIN
jgi:pyruvate dehydrogenase E1 component